jgi:hypothetical protein
VAFLVLLLAAARARIVTANILQRIAHRFMAVIAMRPMIVMVIMLMIVVAVGAMHMGFLIHLGTTPE